MKAMPPNFSPMLTHVLAMCKHGEGVLHSRLVASMLERGAPEGATSSKSVG